jgi:hypothetical protein
VYRADGVAIQNLTSNQYVSISNFVMDLLTLLKVIIAIFDVFAAMIHVEVFWVVMPCGGVGYLRFGGRWCFHLPGNPRSPQLQG